LLFTAAGTSLYGASEFAITGKPIAGLENLTSDVAYINAKLDACGKPPLRTLTGVSGSAIESSQAVAALASSQGGIQIQLCPE
jgi:hypothetical protein